MVTGAATLLPPSSSSASKGMNGNSADMLGFYGTLHRKQDAVLAGVNQQIKLPAHILQKIANIRAVKNDALQSTHNPAQRSGATAPPTTTQGPLTGQSTDNVLSDAVFSGDQPSTSKAQTQTDPPHGEEASGPATDPVRTERKLKRQRIEDRLRGQMRANTYGRGKDFAAEYDTGLDVKALLQRVLSVIKPVSGVSATVGEGEINSSFDENDYYSSQAMSWSTEGTGSAPNSHNVDAMTASAGKASHARQKSSQKTTQLPAEDAATTTRRDVRMEKNVFAVPVNGSGALPPNFEDLPDEDSEDDYSPPPPQTELHSDYCEPDPVSTKSPSRQEISQALYPRYPFSQDLPTVPQAVIHSRIRSPFAPQAARVSPLTLGKVTSIPHQQSGLRMEEVAADQTQPSADDATAPGSVVMGTPRGKSPRGQQGSIKKRKRNQFDDEMSPDEAMRVKEKKLNKLAKKARKREQRKELKQGQEQARVSSPKPFIKPEPVSPPPLQHYPERVLDSSALYGGAAPRFYRLEDQPQYEPRVAQAYGRVTHTLAGPENLELAQSGSGDSRIVRRGEYDNTDLRRVASLQASRRQYSPPLRYREGDRIMAAPPARALSYSYAGSGAGLDSVYRDDPRYAVVPRPSSGSPVYVDEHGFARPAQRIERLMPPGIVDMPPPTHFQAAPTTIIEDQHGNRYFATPAPPDTARTRNLIPGVSRYEHAIPRPITVMEDRSGRVSVVYGNEEKLMTSQRYQPLDRVRSVRPVLGPQMPDLAMPRAGPPVYREAEPLQQPQLDRYSRSEAGRQQLPLDSGLQTSTRIDAMRPPLPDTAGSRRKRGGLNSAALGGRQLLRYDEYGTSPRQVVQSSYSSGAGQHDGAADHVTRSYSAHPGAGRRYPDDLVGEQGHAIHRVGSTAPSPSQVNAHTQGRHIMVDQYGRPVEPRTMQRDYRL